MYNLRVTVTLNMTSDLVFRIIMSVAYLLYYLRQESQIWCVNASLGGGVSRPKITVTLTSFLESASSLVHIFYIL